MVGSILVIHVYEEGITGMATVVKRISIQSVIPQLL